VEVEDIRKRSIKTTLQKSDSHMNNNEQEFWQHSTAFLYYFRNE